MCLHHFQGSLSEAIPTEINFYLNLCFMHLGPLKVESCLYFSSYYSTMKFLGSIVPFLQHVSNWVMLWFNHSYWWSGQVGEWGGGRTRVGTCSFAWGRSLRGFQEKRRGPTLPWEDWATSTGLESLQKSGFWEHQPRCLHPMYQHPVLSSGPRLWHGWSVWLGVPYMKLDCSRWVHSFLCPPVAEIRTTLFTTKKHPVLYI